MRFRNNSFERISSEKDSLGHVFSIFIDSREQVWFGSENGVYTIQDDKLVKSQKLQIKDVTSIAEDSSGTLYFGGFNYGLFVYDTKTGIIKQYSTANNLPNDGVKSLFVDGNHLWIGTNNNVLKVNIPQLQQQKKFIYNRYTSQNGFLGLEVCHSCITKDQDNILWFGTSKGLTKYLPDLDRKNEVYPEIVFSDVKLFMRPVNWKELGYNQDSILGLPQNLKLPYNRNHITISYNGICLSNPGSVRYRYKLAGYEDSWSDASDQPFATYSNLEPGKYSFQVIASNNSGYWTPKPAIFTFYVDAPLWQREWFMGLLLLLLSGILLTVIRMRERGLKKMNLLLDLRVKHRTRLLEKKHLEKEMLLKEIHHRVKNNLQIVISLLNLQARHIQDPEAQEAMRAIRSRVRSMSLLHERLYQVDDLAHINLRNYFQEICESLYDSFGVTKEEIDLVINVPPIQLDIDAAITLGLIVNELVSNSLKYAFVPGQHGQLTISIQQNTKSEYILTVQDNGRGIPVNFENQQNSTFGLNLVAALSKNLDGKLHFENNNGTKSILYFVLSS
jgi:two-component sensor histidine kinase